MRHSIHHIHHRGMNNFLPNYIQIHIVTYFMWTLFFNVPILANIPEQANWLEPLVCHDEKEMASNQQEKLFCEDITKWKICFTINTFTIGDKKKGINWWCIHNFQTIILKLYVSYLFISIWTWEFFCWLYVCVISSTFLALPYCKL